MTGTFDAKRSDGITDALPGCYYIADYILHKSISYLICPFLNFLKVLKAFQSVPPAIFISCYNLLLDFLSLNFALVSIRNMREKDITQGKA